MKIRLAALFAALTLASASAFAFHCPADMKKIDAALAKNPKLSAQQMADVKKYRADGEAWAGTSARRWVTAGLASAALLALGACRDGHGDHDVRDVNVYR